MKKNTNNSKQMLFEMMHKIAKMPLNENIEPIYRYENIDDWLNTLNIPEEVKFKIEDFCEYFMNEINKGIKIMNVPLTKLSEISFDREVNPNEEKTPINNEMITYLQAYFANVMYENYKGILNSKDMDYHGMFNSNFGDI